jgi:uncharacterized protein (TIGR02246 family)
VIDDAAVVPTRTSNATGGERELAERLTRMEDVHAIQQLVARYGFAVDDRDVEGVMALFTDHGSLRTASGPSKGQGVAAVGEYFTGRFAVLGPTHHFTHGHVIDFDADDAGLARGTVSSHAEVWRDGAPMLTALRYLDTYVKRDGEWRFLERVQSYMYFVDVREYPEAFGDRLRVRLSGTDWRPADWPVAFT